MTATADFQTIIYAHLHSEMKVVVRPAGRFYLMHNKEAHGLLVHTFVFNI